MSTPLSSCPTIKANASLRRSCGSPPAKNAAIGRCRANRRQQPRDSSSSSSCSCSSSSTASTEQLSMVVNMVGIRLNGLTSRLACMSIINWHSEVMYDMHVQVAETVMDHRTHVSGISPEDLLESSGVVSFDDAHGDVMDLIRGKVLIGHGLRGDFAAL
ncbi:hypothetical protein ACHAW5_008795 [Stephanodiscus triporus]|uniref:Exonuclease domain-containing protein n=1 Tax=Stephanodiscus triporus TaxID=2934178 RepID=A0ABD3MRW8_9STRA